MDEIGRVDVAAPGVGVYSTWIGGVFKTISGTSMAAPHVAGVAALVVEKHGKAVAGKSVWQQLATGAKSLGEHADLGAGLVQAP